MLRLFYRNSKSLLKTVYFIPLEGGWISVLISVFGSLLLAPVLTVGILTTHLFKLFDLVWVRLSYLWCGERHLLLEPLNDVDYLMWRSNFFGQTLIMCFFVTDRIPMDQMERHLVWRIENKDAFQESAEASSLRGAAGQGERGSSGRVGQPNSQRKNKRFFCRVESSLGRLWFKYAGEEYDTARNIVKLAPRHARMVLSRPELVMDKDSLRNLEERVSDLCGGDGQKHDDSSLSEEEVKELYGLLFNCEDSQLSVRRPCWRIILLDDAVWKGNHSSILIGQFHHVIGDGSTLTEFVKKTVLDNPEPSQPKREVLKGVTRSARFWHQWVSGLLWAAVAGPITLLKAALQARPERSWDTPSRRRARRSNKISPAGPINLSLRDVNLVKDRLNEELNSREEETRLPTSTSGELQNPRDADDAGTSECSLPLFEGSREKPELTHRRAPPAPPPDSASKRGKASSRESHKFSKRITFNDIILSCIASGYSKYVNYYISTPEIRDDMSNSSTSAHSPASKSSSPTMTMPPLTTLATPSSRRSQDNSNKENATQSVSSPFHFDDKSPYSSVLKYDSISSSQDFDGELDLQLKLKSQAKLNALHSPSCSPSKESDLSLLCHSNLNVVVTTNNRVRPPTKLDNAFSTIVLPIPTCPLASPSERLRCVFESLQEYRKTSLPIIFIRYIQYTLRLSPYALLCLWRPHSKSCSMYYSSVPGPKSCNFMNKKIIDMTFALPLTDHIGLGVSVFSFDDKVSVSCTFDEEIILNPSLLLDSIKLSFEELKAGVLAKI